MKGFLRNIVTAALFLGVVSCENQEIPSVDQLLSRRDSIFQTSSDDFKLNEMRFSDDYKIMDLHLLLIREAGPYDLSDKESVKVSVKQQTRLTTGVEMDDPLPPVLTNVVNVEKIEMAKRQTKLLILVDLSLPQPFIDQELEAVEEMLTLMTDSTLYVAFMQGETVSESYRATDYILENYFKHQDPSHVFLYRSIQEKMAEMNDTTSVFSDARYKFMVVLSNGNTYENDRPIDPKHFELQQAFTDLIHKLTGKMGFYYVNFNTMNPDDDLQSTDDTSLMRYLCQNLSGLYQSSFNWYNIKQDFLKDNEIDFDDYHLSFQMPDNKAFRGNRNILTIDFSDIETGDHIASCEVHYYLGSLYYPVIINGKSTREVVLQGMLVTALFLIAIWLALQLVVPWVRYQHFLKHHVFRYSGPQMSVDGEMLSESCYYCKAPFEVGDEVVAKCKHTMHKDCWDEIGYHCPEYGRNCQHGSHYYNPNNLLDHHNTIFYLDWILAGILSGFLAWAAFIIHHSVVKNNFITKLALYIHDIQPNSPEAEEFITNYSVHLGSQPSFGFTLAFFTTLCLSVLSVRKQKNTLSVASVLFRTVVASALSYLFFTLACLISIEINLKTESFFIDCIPWILMVYTIIYFVTAHTRIRVRIIGLAIACLLGIMSMYAWVLFYRNTFVDYRLTILLSFIFVAVVMALCIACEAPKSERYFLQAEGSIKPIDIALYKWFRSNPNYVASLGKAVDCSIQLSWDLTGQIAPVQAEIKQKHGTLYLYAIEKGVEVEGKPLELDKAYRLIHGSKFKIGQTEFTYIEKDHSGHLV